MSKISKMERVIMCGCDNNNQICNLSTLVILILIIFQFSKKNTLDETTSQRSKPLVDNSILFIIALFFLSCCKNY